jgi:hypothetical protein
MSQEWLHKRVWKPTLRRAGIAGRGQYAIRDTFISLAFSSGEDPGWVAQGLWNIRSNDLSSLSPLDSRSPGYWRGVI